MCLGIGTGKEVVLGRVRRVFFFLQGTGVGERKFEKANDFSEHTEYESLDARRLFESIKRKKF